MGLRWRLVLSLLSGRPVHVSKIRPHAARPGLSSCEASLLRLLGVALSAGSRTTISETGTAMRFVPGHVVGGTFEHTCDGAAVGYFAEALLVLAMAAGAKPTVATLRGPTASGDGGVGLGADALMASVVAVAGAFLPLGVQAPQLCAL